jgi:hypothetical protein
LSGEVEAARRGDRSMQQCPAGRERGSASRRFAGCMDGGRRAWPAGAAAALVDPRSGLAADLPGPARRPAAHQASPPLACCQAPTTSTISTQAGTTKPEPHGALTVLPDGGARRTRSGAGPRHPRRGDRCWIVSVGGCGSQAGRSALAGRWTRGEAQPLGILNGQLSFSTRRSRWTWQGSGEPCRSGGS